MVSYAVNLKEYNLVEVLLKLGANMNAQNDSAILQVFQYMDIKMIQLFMDYGLNINNINSSLIKYAVRNIANTNYLPFNRLILENLSNPDFELIYDHFLISSYDYPVRKDYVLLLQEFGCVFNEEHLLMAIDRDYFTVAETLLELGVTTNKITAFAKNERVEMLNLLKKYDIPFLITRRLRKTTNFL